jgi:hypothetical protein
MANKKRQSGKAIPNAFAGTVVPAFSDNKTQTTI